MSHDYLIIKVHQGLEKIILDPNFFYYHSFHVVFQWCNFQSYSVNQILTNVTAGRFAQLVIQP